MTGQAAKRIRYAPETAIVEVAIVVSDRVRDATSLAHPVFRAGEPIASTEERLAVSLLRANERFRRAASRYLDYVDGLVRENDPTPDPRQIEMF